MSRIEELTRRLQLEDTRFSIDKKVSIDIETELKREELENRKQDRTSRKRYSWLLFSFLIVYLAAVFILLFLCAYKCSCFELSDKVIITLLTTTTANVISIFAFVVKYLFSR